MRASYFLTATVLMLLLTLGSAIESYLIVYTDLKKLKMKVSLANFGYFKYGFRISGRVQIGFTHYDSNDNPHNKDHQPKDAPPKHDDNHHNDDGRNNKDEQNHGNPNSDGHNNNNNRDRKKDENNQPNFNINDFLNVDITGCQSGIRQFNDEYIAQFGQPLLFVERGSCSFTRKALLAQNVGKLLIIGDTSEFEDVDDIIMSEADPEGENEKVTMPVVMISKADTIILKNYLMKEIGAGESTEKSTQIWAQIIVPKPRDGSKANMSYWMIPSKRQSYSLLWNHKEFLDGLITTRYANFEAHFIFFKCKDDPCHFAGEQSHESFETLCLFGGEFCNMDPDGQDGPLTGADVVVQSVREMCIQKMFPEYFPSYFYNFHQCYVVNKQDFLECNEASVQFVLTKHEEAERKNFVYHTQQCTTENTLKNPTLLEEEFENYTQAGIKFFPTLFVNGDIFRGNLFMQEPSEQFICRGIEDAQLLQECIKYQEIKSDPDIDGQFEYDSTETHRTIVAFVSILIFSLFILGLFVYRRRIRIEMSKQITVVQATSAIKEYHTLHEDQ